MGFPYSTFGENIPLLLQNLVLLYLIDKYSGKGYLQSGSILFIVVSFVSLLKFGMVPLSIMQVAQGGTVGIFAASKLPQIYENWKTKSSGQLSFVTFFLVFGGSSARVFTTVSEIEDPMTLFAICSSW